VLLDVKTMFICRHSSFNTSDDNVVRHYSLNGLFRDLWLLFAGNTPSTAVAPINCRIVNLSFLISFSLPGDLQGEMDSVKREECYK
jgi:hypothetical protein